MSVAVVAVVAHQGGWDEILMVAGPLLVFASVLWLANRRANNRLAALAATDGDGEPDPEVNHLAG